MNPCLKGKHLLQEGFDKRMRSLLHFLLLASTYSHTKPFVYVNLSNVIIILLFFPIHQLIYFSFIFSILLGMCMKKGKIKDNTKIYPIMYLIFHHIWSVSGTVHITIKPRIPHKIWTPKNIYNNLYFVIFQSKLFLMDCE